MIVIVARQSFSTAGNLICWLSRPGRLQQAGSTSSSGIKPDICPPPRQFCQVEKVYIEHENHSFYWKHCQFWWTNYACWWKKNKCWWKNCTFWVENNYAFWVEKNYAFWVEKNWAKKFANGEKMTNVKYEWKFLPDCDTAAADRNPISTKLAQSTKYEITQQPWFLATLVIAVTAGID